MRTASVIPISIQRMICTGCGAEANAACNCGKDYKPKAVIARAAVEANPEKSDRAIAADIGVAPNTVKAARDELRNIAQLEDQPRIGLDGKTRKMPERSYADPGAAQINSICNSAYDVLSEAEGIIDEEISLEDDAREALANALHSCGDSLKRLAKTISRGEK